MANVEEIKARMAAKRAALEAVRVEQEVKDFEAYEAACEEHGYDAVARLMLPRYVEGLPTFALVKAASADLSKIHRDRILKAKRGKDGAPDAGAAVRAAAEVGRACVVYPDADTCAAIREHIEDLYVRAGTAALDLSRMQTEEEGKG